MMGIVLHFTLYVVMFSTLGRCTVHDYDIIPVYGDSTSDVHGVNLCASGYFLCNDTSKCVAQRLNCDGLSDCDDGSDEWNCNDHVDSRYWDHLFRKQPSARSDDITMGTCYWNDLNTTCLCRGSELHCQLQKLNELPKNLPDNGITLLDLTGNNFPVITNNFFKDLPQVEILVLKHCTIEKIHPNAFQSFSRIFLDTLYLNQNKLTSIPEYLFPKSNLLKILILSGNQINQLHANNFKNLDLLYELDLRDNHITTFTDEVFKPLHSLEILYLNGNGIPCIQPGMLPPLPLLQTLSLAHNQIKFISRDSFDFPNLKMLFLSGNRIYKIKNATFCGLPNMLGLNLDDNEIYELEIDSFLCVENLTSLFLKGNRFKSLDRRVLMNLINLDHIYFSWFHLCKTALHVRVCEPKGDGISSTRHLLDNTLLRGSVWIMAAIGIVGNIVVLFGRFFQNSRSHVEHSIYLRHLAASDLLMGIYLATIASADIMFRGEYIKHEESWRESVACATCGFLSTLSCQSSTLLLTLVTWDRLISVTRPLQPRSTGKTRVALRLSLLWGSSVAAAAAPLSSLSYFGDHFYGNNGVCLSLHIHEPYAKGWEYSAGIFIVINTFSLAFIIVSYLRMLRAIRGSGEAMRSTLSGRENIVARRFAVIVATDCACWLPIILVKIAALAGLKISPSLYAWLAVLVLPVNSALNPVLYTLTTASFKQQVTRYFYALHCGAAIESRTQTGYESALSLSLGHPPPSRRKLLQKTIPTEL